MTRWVFVKEVVRIVSQWATLFGERWVTDKGQELEYWRVERPDSVIVLPIHKGDFLLPHSCFRPGVKRGTLDFPGGRHPAQNQLRQTALQVLERELGVPETAVTELVQLNEKKWDVDSSFSCQGLWVFFATIDEAYPMDKALVGACVKADESGVKALLGRLDCLQCRASLLEWAQKRLN